MSTPHNVNDLQCTATRKRACSTSRLVTEEKVSKQVIHIHLQLHEVLCTEHLLIDRHTKVEVIKLHGLDPPSSEK